MLLDLDTRPLLLVQSMKVICYVVCNECITVFSPKIKPSSILPAVQEMERRGIKTWVEEKDKVGIKDLKGPSISC